MPLSAGSPVAAMKHVTAMASVVHASVVVFAGPSPALASLVPHRKEGTQFVSTSHKGFIEKPSLGAAFLWGEAKRPHLCEGVSGIKERLLQQGENLGETSLALVQGALLDPSGLLVLHSTEE